MVTAIQVPTNGFQAPPAPGQPPSNPTPGQTPEGVPPAPNAITSTPAGGAPVQLPGQQPGWLPQGQPTQPAAAGQPDLNGIVGLLQAALASQPGAVPPAQSAPQVPPTAPGKLNTFDVSSIGDPIIQSMASILQTAGKDLDLDRVLGRALQFGDPALVDVAYLREAGGANAQQFTEIAQGIVKAVQAKADAVEQSVFASVGGEAVWQASVAAFNTNAPQELRVTVAQMLNSTNEQFIQAGAKIVAQFGAQSGALPNPAQLVQSGAAGPMTAQGLTKEQFQAELRKLDNTSRGYEDARNALFARRQIGKRAGM